MSGICGGFFDYGSWVIRNLTTPKFYNDPEKEFGLANRFPLYVRGPLHVISMDLLRLVVFRRTHTYFEDDYKYTAHPDDPALGVYLFQLVSERITHIQVDDRDESRISLNPFCFHSFSRMHHNTWAVHHINATQMICMFKQDFDFKNSEIRTNQTSKINRLYYQLEEEEKFIHLYQNYSPTALEEFVANSKNLPKLVAIYVRRNNLPDLCPCATGYEHTDEPPPEEEEERRKRLGIKTESNYTYLDDEKYMY